MPFFTCLRSLVLLNFSQKMNIPFQIASNTFYQLLGRFLTSFSTVIVTIIITSNFSIADFGNFVVITSYISLFYVFTDFGLNAIYVREVGNDKAKQANYFRNLIGIRVALSTVFAFLAVAILGFSNHSSQVKLGIILALGILITQSLSMSVLAFFQTKIKYQYALIGDFLYTLSAVCLVYFSAIFGSNILLVILALVIASFIKTSTLLYISKIRFDISGIEFDFKFWKKFIITALPIGLITIFSQINAHIDKQIVFLSSYNTNLGYDGAVAAGIYGLSYKVFEFAIVLPSFIMNIGFPIMIQKKTEGFSHLLNFSKKLGIILLSLGLLCLFIGWFITPFLIDILGQGKFIDSVYTTRILLFGFPLFFITPLSLWLAITLKKELEILFIYSFVAVTNIVLNLYFVPVYGYNAAALITILSELLLLFLTAFLLFISIRNKQHATN